MLELKVHSSTANLTLDQLNEIAKIDEEAIAWYLSDPFTFNIGVVWDNNKILAAGLVRVVDEVKLIVDPELSDFKKAKIIKLLLDNAIKYKHTNEVLAIITKGGWSYKEMLEKHYHFYDTHGFAIKLER